MLFLLTPITQRVSCHFTPLATDVLGVFMAVILPFQPLNGGFSFSTICQHLSGHLMGVILLYQCFWGWFSFFTIVNTY